MYSSGSLGSCQNLLEGMVTAHGYPPSGACTFASLDDVELPCALIHMDFVPVGVVNVDLLKVMTRGKW